MLGLFMVLPVLTLYGEDYRFSSPLLLGVALGAYGFSQALLQIPFGWWSDRWGRRPVIAVGLLIFAFGSLVAALSETVYGLIIGRFLQGSGAIASALMALVADVTSDKNRSKAMAVIGMSIGVSFAIALVVGPIVTHWGGLSGIFWLTIALALVGLGILYLAFPHLDQAPRSATTDKTWIGAVITNKDLLRLDWGILTLHLVLMANFVAIPSLLENTVGIERQQHWWVYLPILVGAFALMLPMMVVGERKGYLRAVFLGAIVLLLLSELALVAGYRTPAVLLTCLFLFFLGFNFLEATLPSQVSKMAPTSLRGTASGVYSSSQFFGAFLGGLVGGLALSFGGVASVFMVNALALLIWLIIAWPMVNKPEASSRVQQANASHNPPKDYNGVSQDYELRGDGKPLRERALENAETVQG